jgi:hypothetical protein
MEFSTFADYFRFRDKCLCGGALATSFTYSSHDDDYIHVKPMGSYFVDKKELSLVFPLEIESRLSPHGEVAFHVVCHLVTNKLHVNTKSFTNTQISPLNFVEQHLDIVAQQCLNFKMLRTCTSSNDCNSHYELIARPLTFDIRGGTYNPIQADCEHFNLVDNAERKYRFLTDFKTGNTTIHYDVTNKNSGSIILPLEKFVKYPVEREFLLNKVKTLILFT